MSLTTLVTVTRPTGDSFTALADGLYGRAGDASGGELEFPCVHCQPQGWLLVHQGERAFDRADRAVEGVDDVAAAGGRSSPEPLDGAEQGHVRGVVGGQQGR